MSDDETRSLFDFDLITALRRTSGDSAKAADKNNIREDSLQRLSRNIEQHLCDENAVEASDIWSGVISGDWSVLGVWETPEGQCLIAKKNASCKNSGKRLSEREVQVVSLAVRGHANKYIAIELGLTESTVATHLRRAMGKLRVRSRTQLIRAFPEEVFD
jgi:DNA-binding CsgD family transcriptional regulator